MRFLAIILGLLFLVLQYDLWVGEGSFAHVWRLTKQVEKQAAENKQLRERNDALIAEVNDLREGKDAIEERARSELGMVKKGEVYIQVIDDKKNKK